MSDRQVDHALDKAAELILKGRYGRACRIVSRVMHTPAVLFSETGRTEWARMRVASSGFAKRKAQ